MRKNIFTKIAAVAAATVLAVTALPALVSDTYAADDEYSYVYAGLTWQEYWANEGVYNAGDVTSSNEKDTHGEGNAGCMLPSLPVEIPRRCVSVMRGWVSKMSIWLLR